MRIVQQQSFGGPDVLRLADVPAPQPAPGEVLIRVAHAGVNPVDTKARRGEAVAGLMGPFPLTVGWDVAGTVAAVGAAPSGSGAAAEPLREGDRVFGMLRFPMQAAAYAEYVVAPAEQVVLTPAEVSDREAAALPMASLTAWQALTDAAVLAAGQRLLVQGGGGGVGHLAVQIARCLGAHVVVTAGGGKRDWLLGLGAHQVIDHRTEDFVESLQDDPVDVVLDLVGGPLGPRSVAVLKPGGVLLELPDPVDEQTRAATDAAGVRVVHPEVHADRAALLRIADLAGHRVIAPTVTGEFPLERAADAHVAIEGGHVQGKLVLTP